jgi:hypothetical protein
MHEGRYPEDGQQGAEVEMLAILQRIRGELEPDITRFYSERFGGQAGQLTTSRIGKSLLLLHFSGPQSARACGGHPLEWR